MLIFGFFYSTDVSLHIVVTDTADCSVAMESYGTIVCTTMR